MQKCAEKVVVPDEIGCCCWFGVHGFIHPEENASTHKSLENQLAYVVENAPGVSRSCDIGLSFHSLVSHRSIVCVVDEATRNNCK